MAPHDSPAAWGLVVPVKRLAVAKSRLSAYGDEVRRALALAFAQDVVAAALACPAVRGVLVVTDDPLARAELAGLGADVVGDGPDAGLNPALAHGAALLRGRPGGDALGVATLSADLPALRADDLGEALGLVPAGGRGFVPDARGEGTTLLAAAPGRGLGPSYGAGSRARHLASGAVELAAATRLRLDVDTPQDLDAALRLGAGAWTTAVLAGLAGLAGG